MPTRHHLGDLQLAIMRVLWDVSEATVNEPLLRSMADVADGRFFRADDPDTLAQVYDTIDELERSRVGPERFAEFDELAPWFLGAALAALLAEVLLASFVLRRLA